MNSPRLFLLGCYAFVTLGVSAGVIGPGLPTLASQAGVSLDQAGYLFTALSLGYLVSAPIISWAGPRLGTRAMLILSPLISIASMLLFALGRAMPPMMVGAVLLGLGQSGTQVAYNAMFGTSGSGSDSASKKLGQLNAFYGIGALLAPLVASFGYAQFGAATVAFFAAAVLLAVLSLGAVVWRGAPDKEEGRQGDKGNNSAVLSPLPLVPLFSLSPLRSNTLWLMGAAMGLYVGCEVAFSGWTTEFTRRSTGIPLAEAAASTSVFWVGLALSRYLTPSLLRIKPTLLVLVMLGLAMLGYGLMVTLGAQLMWVLVGAFIIGAGMGPVYPTLLAIGIQRFPHHATLIASVLTSAGSFGALFLPAWVGVVLTTQSVLGAWLLQAGVLVGVMALWLWVKRSLDLQSEKKGEKT